MKLQLLAVSTLLAVATAAYADNTFERTLSVSSQADVYVSTGAGDIKITPSSDNQVHVKGHVHASWSAFGDVKSREQRIIDNPPIVQNGNQIRIGETTDRGLLSNISIDYELSVPSSVALNLHSGSGDIEVANVGRYLSAATGSGSVRIHEFNGGLTLRTGSGDIEANGRLASSSNVNTGSGSVRLHLNPDSHFNLQAATGSGDIRVNFPGAPKQDDNSRHHLTASINGGGDPLEIHTGSGDIEVTPR